MGESDRIQIKIGDKVVGSAPLDEAYIVLSDTVEPGQENDKVFLHVNDGVKNYDTMGYTTDLGTMELIFQNQTLRSSSLTNAKLNDPVEKERVGITQFAGSRFITCFSHEGHESVPFWIYYGGNVREKKVLLQSENFTDSITDKIQMDYCLVPGDKKCFFNSDEYTKTINVNGVLGNSMGLKPINTDYDLRSCIGSVSVLDIEYVPCESEIFTEDNSGVTNADLSPVSTQENTVVSIQGYDISCLGKQKSNPWEYEKESRILTSLSSTEFCEWDYIDLRLKPEFFKNLRIILSPWENEDLYQQVRDIVSGSDLPEDIKDSIVIQSSGLKGKLNFPE